MDIKQIKKTGLEELWRAEDQTAQFRSFIAIHSTRRGPSLGGVRCWNYPDESSARADAIRLSEAMTYKSAVADLPFGGGKAVILKPSGDFDRKRIYECFAHFVNHLDGRYITAKDVGTTGEDINHMHQFSSFVTGRSVDKGGLGDPSIITARGVLQGIKASVQYHLKRDSLKGIRIAIQGLGAVGTALARMLDQEGTILWGSDIDSQQITHLVEGIRLHPQIPELILYQEVDVLVPCALGQVLSDTSIPKIKASVIAGAANDQLKAGQADAILLKQKNILYAPDFVINAGGLILVAAEYSGKTTKHAEQVVDTIGPTLLALYEMAVQKDESTVWAAKELARSRLT
jgi:leucine dehydrogenase